MNTISRFAVLLSALLLALTLCAPALAEDNLFSKKDQTLASEQDASILTLTGDSIRITQAGTYLLTGTIENGSIAIDLAQEGDVYLLLSGVSVHNENGAALTSTGCKKLILTLAEDTQNTFSQGTEPPDAEDNDAAIFSRDDLTINGSGTLTVTGAYQDGINCRDALRIVSGTLRVTAADDAIIGKDEVTIGEAVITAQAQAGDAIKATNDEDEARGFVAIAGGVVSAVTGGGHVGITADADGGWGMRGYIAENPESASQKGIKAASDIRISGGSITVDTVDDALHANGNITVTGGSITAASDDDGLHADGTLRVTAGSIEITASYEGLEATDILLEGGVISVIASDDGINGAGGDSGTETDTGWGGEMGRFGRDMFSASTGTLTLSGGDITVIADGDGLDVNGSLTMTGGIVRVRGAQNTGNAALDYDGSFTMTGGTLLAIGMSGMAQGVSAPSVPGTAVSISESGLVTVSTENGTTLVTFDAPGNYNHAVIYSDQFTEGETISLQTGTSQQQVTVSVQATNTGMGGFGSRGNRDGMMPGEAADGMGRGSRGDRSGMGDGAPSEPTEPAK